MERIKNWFHFNSENIKGLLKISFLILLPISFFYISQSLRHISMINLRLETIGIVDTLIQIKGIHESDAGGKIITKAYHLHYHYEIDNSRYDKQEIIQRATIRLEDRFRLSKLEKGDTITIKYKENHPSKSMILINK